MAEVEVTKFSLLSIKTERYEREVKEEVEPSSDSDGEVKRSGGSSSLGRSGRNKRDNGRGGPKEVVGELIFFHYFVECAFAFRQGLRHRIQRS